MNLLHIAFRIASPKNAPKYMPDKFSDLDDEFQELFKIMFNFSNSTNSTQKDYEEYFKNFPKDLFNDTSENDFKEILEHKIEDAGLSDMMDKNINEIKETKSHKFLFDTRTLEKELIASFHEIKKEDKSFNFKFESFDPNAIGPNQVDSNVKVYVLVSKQTKMMFFKILKIFKKHIKNFKNLPSAVNKYYNTYFEFKNVDLDEVDLYI